MVSGYAPRCAKLPGSALDIALDRSVLIGYSRWGYRIRRRLRLLPRGQADPVPKHKNAIVTGANSGLGSATVAGLAALGVQVHLVVRDVSKGNRTRSELLAEFPSAKITVWHCDLADLDDVRRFAGEFRAKIPTLDILVHNAGVLPKTRVETSSGHEITLATHVLGPLLLTEHLRQPLRNGGAGRVIFVSSGGMYTQKLPSADPEYRFGAYRGATAYARTKRIQVSFTPMLAQRYADDGITVQAMHPGWVDTAGVSESLPVFHRLVGGLLRSSEQGADTVVWLATQFPVRQSGHFWHDRIVRPVHLLPNTRESESDRERLWEWCWRALDVQV